MGLIAAAAALVALPAAASAAITPALTLDQTAGTTAGSNPATGFNATFAPASTTPTDTVKDVKLGLPPGLLANENIAGGACLLSSTPNPSCQIGSGSITAGGTSIPATAYLTKAPSPSDVGGLTIVAAPLPPVTGDITLGTSGLTVAFSNLSPGLSGMDIKFTNLRLPTSCPSPAANVTVTAVSQSDPTAKTATAPLTVTGCSSLPYAPTVTGSVTKDAKDSGAAIVVGLTQAANESANKTIVLGLPKGLTPNVGADAPCLNATGCTVGSATATSPLVPNIALANGTVKLTASGTTPTIAITFPTLGITLPGTVSLTDNTVTFANVPDVPLTSLNLTITGPNGQKAFNTDCTPGNVAGNFTAQGGQTHTSTAPINFTGCAAKPTATGSISGLASGHPKLKVKITHGKGSANVASVAIGVPAGLKFSRSAFVSHKTCTTVKGKKKCTTTTLIRGLGISGAKAKSVAIKGGKLVVTLKKAAQSVTVSATGPLVSETKSLQTKVKKHKTKSVKFSLKVTDAKKAATPLSLNLKAH